MPISSLPDQRAQYAEVVILEIKPHPAFIVLRSGMLLIGMTLLLLVSWSLAAWFNAPRALAAAQQIVAAAVGIVLVWNVLVWLARGYRLTDRRLLWSGGVLSRSLVEIPLHRVQHITLHRSLIERLLGLGSLGFSTAGGAWTEMFWMNIEHPRDRLEQLRAAIEHTRPADRGSSEPPPETRLEVLRNPDPSPARIPVIGLAGGIGAGKSEVARLLADLGCLVIDSDQQAREALDRPEIRDQLVQWWGREILRTDGLVDRSQVARIVFGHEDQRRRLEQLVHPLVRAKRADLIKQAVAAGARAAVIDAPLLFEAGVDAECDAVLFVHAPRELRLRRVEQNRGWAASELDRRQRAQLPIEEKLARSTHIIQNVGARDELKPQVLQAFETITKSFG
jgi:dephospho-CoA kinase